LPQKKNYLASAGTGKTYSLVEEIVSNYIKKGKNINQLFISTFTEKAGAELKSRIYERLKEEIYKDKSSELQESFYEIQNSYIGTLHSLLLRILKNHPEVSKITDKTRIVEGVEFDAIFSEVFDEFIVENEDRTDEIIKLFENRLDVKKLFKDFYQNRWKLDFNLIKEFEPDSERLESHRLTAIKFLDLLISDFYKDFIEFREQKDLDGLKTNLKEIYKKLQDGDFISWKLEYQKNFPHFAKARGLPKELKNIRKKLQKRKEELEPVENELIQILEEIRQLALNLNFLLILKHYQEFEIKLNERKQSENILDYDDIILKTLEIFQKFPQIKEKYNKKFKGIFIDEFQDTDNLQIKVVEILSKGNDLIIFGDPKQCIYEWRHANLEDYLKFIENNFSEEETKNLDICFRSDIDLIGFFNLAFCKEHYDFLNKGIPKEHLQPKFLKPVSFPKNKDPKAKEDTIHLIKSKNRENEPLLLVKTIQNLTNNGYQYKDILVLFRTTTDTEKYIKQLKINNIPFISFLESSFYKNQEVLTVLNLLRLVQYPYNQLNVISVLKSPLFNFSDQDLLNLKDDLQIEKVKELEPVYQLSKVRENKSLSEIIFELFEKLQIFEIFSVFPDGEQKIANLRKLIDYSQKFERDNFNLRDFINFLEENRDTREDEGVLIEDENFVKIMTMHKAKGLESKVVIIPNLSKGKNTNYGGFYTINNQTMVRISSDFKRVIAQSKNFDIDAVKIKRAKEEKRLLYVALTRAKKKLIFIGSDSKNSMKEIENLLNFVKDKKIDVEIKDPSSKQKVDKMEIKVNVVVEDSPDFKEPEPDYWRSLGKEKDSSVLDKLEELKEQEKTWEQEFEKAISSKRFTTVSEIMKEQDEKQFLEKEQIREFEEPVSSYQDKAIQLGILVHKILEEFSFTKDKYQAKTELYELLEKNIKTVNEDFREEIKQNAREIIDKFLNSEHYTEISNSKILFKEMPFTLKEENRYVEGIIDIVYEIDGKIIVLDYKTNKNAEEKEIQEKYKIQAEYYTKAMKKIFPDKEIEFKFALLSV